MPGVASSRSGLSERKNMEYVVGFLFRNLVDGRGYSSVVLIEKNKPDWQRGKLNGVGGKIEEGELAEEAMIREFREETGAEVRTWDKFCVLACGEHVIHFFKSFVQVAAVNIQSLTDEPVAWFMVDDLPNLPVLPNLRWLIPLALDPDDPAGTLENNC